MSGRWRNGGFRDVGPGWLPVLSGGFRCHRGAASRRRSRSMRCGSVLRGVHRPAQTCARPSQVLFARRRQHADRFSRAHDCSRRRCLGARGVPAASPDRRPTTNQIACTGSVPMLERRCGWVDSNEIESPGPSSCCSNPTSTRRLARGDVAVLLACVPHKCARRRRRAADVVDDVEGVDFRVRFCRQPFPCDAALEAYRLAAGTPLNFSNVLRRSAVGATAVIPVEGIWTIEEHLVHRHAELSGDCRQRADRGVRLSRLDLRDQGRRYSDSPRQFAEPDLLAQSGAVGDEALGRWSRRVATAPPSIRRRFEVPSTPTRTRRALATWTTLMRAGRSRHRARTSSRLRGARQPESG